MKIDIMLKPLRSKVESQKGYRKAAHLFLKSRNEDSGGDTTIDRVQSHGSMRCERNMGMLCKVFTFYTSSHVYRRNPPLCVEFSETS